MCGSKNSSSFKRPADASYKMEFFPSLNRTPLQRNSQSIEPSFLHGGLTRRIFHDSKFAAENDSRLGRYASLSPRPTDSSAASKRRRKLLDLETLRWSGQHPVSHRQNRSSCAASGLTTPPACHPIDHGSAFHCQTNSFGFSVSGA